MSSKTILVDEVPWVVCSPKNDGECTAFAKKAGIKNTQNVSVRKATTLEAQKLSAKRSLVEIEGGDPDKVWGHVL